MAIKFFGGKNKLKDLKIKDVQKNIDKQLVETDILARRVRNSDEQIQSIMEAGSEPGVSSVERKVMALDMSRLENKKNRAMSELQDVIKEIESLDNTLALLKDLEAISKKSKGDIYDIPIDDLTDEVKEYAASKAQKRRISEEIDEVIGANTSTENDVRLSKEQREFEEKLNNLAAEKEKNSRGY